MRNRVSVLITLSILILATATLVVSAGNGALEGRVTGADGVPLPGANLILSGPKLQEPIGTVTANDGSYELAGLASGTYVLEVSHIGYRAAVIEGLHITAGKTRSLDIELEDVVIYLEQSVISASRTREKILDAPASVSVIESEEIRSKPVLSISEHVRDLPGIVFAKNGLVQSNIVGRGFNNIFSGALMTLTDNRIARVPSLRLNAHNFIPVVNEDVDRIEVVLGPGSALYGPNSANGVMHIITRSPFASAGTNVQIGLGERSLRKGSMRHAGLISPTLAYKISAQYYTGSDWKFDDPAEAAARTADPTLKARDFDIERQSAELRVDYRPTEDLTAILATGYNQGDFIELTGLGAGQVINWGYQFVQARVLYKNLFAQVFQNSSDAGDTFLLGNGNPIVDKSKLRVFQLQHAYELGGKQRFTYGVDGLLTRPDTDGTITGNNENDDDINEYGVYVQSESDLTEQLDLVLALRYDTHNRLKDSVLSPRAALVFKPYESQTFRATYNRAFDTPTTNNLYLDLESRTDPFGIGSSFEPSLGFAPNINLNAQGTYRQGFDEGFTFRRSGGTPMYRTPFQPVIAGQLGALGLSSGDPGYSIQDGGYIAMDDPIATNVMWGLGRGAVLAQLTPTLQLVAPGLVAQQLVAAGMGAADAQTAGEAATAAAIEQLPAMIPAQLEGLTNSMLKLNLQTLGFEASTGVFDVPRTKPTITQTFEFGYKGIIGRKLVFAADAYRSTVEDFVGPLAVETPNVFLDATSLTAALGPALGAAMADPSNADAAAVLGGLDQLSLPGVSEGNNDGTAVDELTTIFVSGVARIPFGTVSPEQAYDSTAVILTYRNFGDVTIYGVDLSASYYPNEQWTVAANYSFVNDDFFKNLGGIADVALNAPKQKVKVSGSYDASEWDLRLGARLRYNGSFPMNSGVYVGNIDSYTVLDLNAVYDLPFGEGLSLIANVDNALDNNYRSFIGAPEIGRLAYFQLGLAF